MKEWNADHPKAKLMSRKRDMIVEAASEAFLREGYSGASMERIAVAAGVSIMTLYRHAKGKDDLFAAVIAKACHPADQADSARIETALQQSLHEVLIFVGLMFQERLISSATTALLRTVMVETDRFPHLADLAYQGLIGSHQDALETFLAERTETAWIDAGKRHRLTSAFLNRLVGTDIFGVLLGLPGISEEQRRDRADAATSDFMAALTARDCCGDV